MDTCECGRTETPHRILEDCPIFNEDGQEFQNAMGELDLRWPEEKWEFLTKAVYPHFPYFTRKVLQAKERKKRRTLREMGGTPQLGRPPERRSTQLEEQTGRSPRRRPRLARRVPEQRREEEEEESNAEGPTTMTAPESGETNINNNSKGNSNSNNDNHNNNEEEDGNTQ